MVVLGTPVLRRAVAALLMLTLTLAGVGRSVASLTGEPVGTVIIAGFVVHQCHTDAGADPADGPASKRDCCEDCALCGPVILPAPASARHPPARIVTVDPVQVAPWTPHVSRSRTPRQSQGPPVA